METDSWDTIARAIVDGLYSVVVLWLLIREQNSHAETREQYREDLRDFARDKTVHPTAPPLPRTLDDS